MESSSACAQPGATSSRVTPGRPRIAVLIPALDEEVALPRVLADLAREAVDLVLVVDNGSRDRTAEVAAAAGAHVLHEPRRGYGRACASGLELLLAGAESAIEPLAPEDVIVFLDGDHSDHVGDLPALLAPLLADEADFVLGSRMIDPASRRVLLPQARFGNALACLLMRALFRARHTDLGPFRALRAGTLAHLDMQDRGFGWTIEMQLKARVADLRVREVAVRYRERIGRSKISGTWRGTLGASAKILGWILGWRCALLFTSRRIPKYRRPARSGR
jgi:glycosyltransferase involved in cell wall biosynthesis